MAVAIVAQAVWGMAKNLCPDKERATISLIAVLVVIAVAGSLGQVSAIAAGAVAGLFVCRSPSEVVSGHLPFPASRIVGAICLVLFAILLIGLPVAVAAVSSQSLAVFDAFYCGFRF